MQLIVVGDIHAQEKKLWRMLREAGLADEANRPTRRLLEGDTRLILLGDLVHAKTRRQYADLIGADDYDEYNLDDLREAELRQEEFLKRVMTFQRAVPDEHMIILMGNHDYSVVAQSQGPLRSDDITHLEWKEGDSAIPDDLHEWISSWPSELVIEELHFAHVGPRPEHNTFDTDFYLENRRRWIYEEKDWLEDTPYKLGVYGHTPVRGGVNLTSKGKAILLDTNGHGEEYCFLEINVDRDGYHLRMRGLFFDEFVTR